MIFSSMVFLCIFFPVVLGVYYLCPGTIRNLWLLLASLFFYAYGEPVYIFIMLFSTVFDYCNGRGIAYAQRTGRETTLGRGLLILSVCVNLGVLGFFKYSNFALETWNAMTGSSVKLLSFALPIGISFYTFQTMSYTIDVYRKKVEAQKNIIDFAMYVCLFPQLIAGPIVRYTEVAQQIRQRKSGLEHIAKGLQRFSIGLAKKVLLANQIGALYDRISALTGNDRTTAVVWLGAIAYTFQIYFDFSGYSDMAIGLGKMFGFDFPENFNHPYESKTVTEFWRRWHMTLGGWFREYVYIPLGGNRCGFLRQICNMAIVWFLTGLWHGASWNFVLWGMYYFLLLFIEKSLWKWMEQRKGKRIRMLLGHVYTLVAVVIGWAIFSCEDLNVLCSQIKEMFGFGVAFSNELAVFAWLEYLPWLVLLCVAATELPGKIVRKVFSEDAREVAGAVFSIVLLVASVAFLIEGTYNPFLYFRF